MEARLELNQILKNLMVDLDLKPNVYFQPPPKILMDYPAIVYKRDREFKQYANNEVYRNKTGYLVTVIDEDPDSKLPGAVSNLRHCSFVRHHAADGLNHDIYRLYY